MSTRHVIVSPRGADLDAVSADTRAAVERLWFAYVAQVWTWRGGECVIVRVRDSLSSSAWRAVLRSGGLRRGQVRVLDVLHFRDAMERAGIAFRIKTPRPPRPPLTRAQKMRRVLAIGAHRRGATFRTLRARATPAGSQPRAA